jgi:hypothetical protein
MNNDFSLKIQLPGVRRKFNKHVPSPFSMCGEKKQGTHLFCARPQKGLNDTHGRGAVSQVELDLFA